MTCFWDGILRNINQEDFNLLNINKNNNNKEFIILLKKNNKLCKNVQWQSENINEQLLKENYEMIKNFNENNINQGYDCSSCDPFIILLSELFKINIHHNFNGVLIKYTYTYNNPRKTINFKSNKSHFY
jgi:hypothetical protein